MRKPRLERRLVAVRAEVARLREALCVVTEQLAHVEGVAAEAGTRAIVEGTPLAAREAGQAEGDAQRLRRHRDEVVAQLEALSAESDDLLEQLFTTTEGGQR